MLGYLPTGGPFAKVPARTMDNKNKTDRAQARVGEGQTELNFMGPWLPEQHIANKLKDDADVEKVEITSKNDSDIGNSRVLSADEGNFDGSMSFCDVGSVLSQVEGEDGWCLVGENVID